MQHSKPRTKANTASNSDFHYVLRVKQMRSAFESCCLFIVKVNKSRNGLKGLKQRKMKGNKSRKKKGALCVKVWSFFNKKNHPL